MKPKHDDNEIMINALAGAFSAGAATFLLFPLDQIKINSQLTLAQKRKGPPRLPRIDRRAFYRVAANI